MREDRVAERPRTVVLRWLLPSLVCIAVLWLAAMLIGAPAHLRVAGALGIGLVIGLIVSACLHSLRLRVTVSAQQVRVRGDEQDVTIQRSEVHAVFVEQDDLVVLGPDTSVRARVACTVAETDLAAAFTKHDYPWHDDGDPFIDEYRKWTPDTDGLPAEAEELLRQRATKIDGWNANPANELRDRLAALGVIVRDDGRRQFWRVTE